MKRIIKNIVAVTAMFVSANILQAQQPVNYNLYTINPYLLNPAYTGAGGCLHAFLNNHNQWINLSNAPTTFSFGVHNRFSEKANVGLMIVSDNRYYVNYLTANLTYAYNVKLDNSQELSFGLSAGLANNKLDEGKLGLKDANDPQIPTFNNTRFDAGFGLAYERKALKLGASVPHFFDPIGNFSKQFNVQASYDLYTKSKDWKVTPIVLARNYSVVGLMVDMVAAATWKEMINAQLGFRTDKSLIMGVGFNWNNFNIAYAYQYHTGDLYNQFSPSGTHEIQLAYRLCRAKATETPKEEKNPNADKVKITVNMADEKYGNPVPGNIVISKGNRIVYSGKADDNGITNFYLEPGIYNVDITAKGYLPVQEQMDLSKYEKGSSFEYKLKPIKLEKGLVFKFKSINFETGSDRLMSSSYPILDKIADILKDYPQMVIEVAGHTDNVGDDQANMTLSQKRAAAVVAYLTSKGVKPEQMKAMGYGETQPIASNETQEGRLQNRRVMFTVLEF